MMRLGGIRGCANICWRTLKSVRPQVKMITGISILAFGMGLQTKLNSSTPKITKIQAKSSQKKTSGVWERHVKIVVLVPPSHAKEVREAAHKAGAGRIGKYKNCSFSVSGVARYTPLKGSHPTLGKVDASMIINEEKFETVCPASKVEEVVTAILEAHPYETPGIEVYSLLNPKKVSKTAKSK